MTGIQSSLYTAAIALCVFSAGLLRDRAGRPVTWLTAFLTLATLAFGLELLLVHPAAPLKALWLGLRMGLALLIAPCLWLVIRESIEGVRPGLSELGRAHWAPILAGLVLLIPLAGSAHFGTDFSRPPGAVRPLAFMIHETMLLSIGIFAFQVPIYLWRCRELVLRHPSSPRWLQLPLLVVFTAWLLGLLRTLQCIAGAPAGLSLFFALADVGVTVGAIYLIVRRGPADPETAAPVETCAVPAAVPASGATPEIAAEAKYARSCLDEATRARIRRKLETALGTTELCRDSLLNLRSLSQRIGEKAHYVSQVINQDLGSNFYDLVNRHRIGRARQLLAGEPDQTVLEIALAVGFNSKSTFNTAFRRHTGVTPSEFRAGRREQAGPGLRVG